MDFIVPNVGKEATLNNLISYIESGQIRLASNDVTLSDTTVLGDFTECTGSGYSSQSPASPGGITIDGSGRASVTFAPAVFDGPDDSSNIYMAYITDAGDNLVMAARLDGAPLSIPPTGTLVLTLTNLVQTLFTS